jgi:hypothetical protein
MFTLLKNTIFVVWLIGALASISIGMAIFTFQATATVARLSAEAANTAMRHRKEIAKAVTKVKAKARLKRIITMVPLAGLAAGAYFEEQEYEEWLEDNPDGSRQEYLCEVTVLSSEVLDEVLIGLPELIRPSKSAVTDMMPKCDR